MPRHYVKRVCAGWLSWLALLSLYYGYQFLIRGHLPEPMHTAAEYGTGMIALANG